jgi:hypothetical protein
VLLTIIVYSSDDVVIIDVLRASVKICPCTVSIWVNSKGHLGYISHRRVYAKKIYYAEKKFKAVNYSYLRDIPFANHTY